MEYYEERYITDINKMPQKCRELIEEFKKMGYITSPEYGVEEKECVIILFPPYQDAEVSMVHYYPEEDKVDFSVKKIVKAEHKIVEIPLSFLKEFSDIIDALELSVSIDKEYGKVSLRVSKGKIDKEKALKIIEAFFKSL